MSDRPMTPPSDRPQTIDVVAAAAALASLDRAAKCGASLSSPIRRKHRETIGAALNELARLQSLALAPLGSAPITTDDETERCRQIAFRVNDGALNNTPVSVDQVRHILRASRGSGEPAAGPTDTQRLDWMEEMMRHGWGYCEIFFAGLRRGTQDAAAFQIESNPQKFPTLNADTLRLAIDAAVRITSVGQEAASPAPETR